MTSIQKKTFQKWNNHVRYSYNKAINFINNDISTYKNKDFEINPENFYSSDEIKKINSFNPYSKLDLRNLITPAEVNSHIPWILETPKAVGVFEAYIS